MHQPSRALHMSMMCTLCLNRTSRTLNPPMYLLIIDSFTPSQPLTSIQVNQISHLKLFRETPEQTPGYKTTPQPIRRLVFQVNRR